MKLYEEFYDYEHLWESLELNKIAPDLMADLSSLTLTVAVGKSTIDLSNDTDIKNFMTTEIRKVLTNLNPKYKTADKKEQASLAVDCFCVHEEFINALLDKVKGELADKIKHAAVEALKEELTLIK